LGAATVSLGYQLTKAQTGHIDDYAAVLLAGLLAGAVFFSLGDFNIASELLFIFFAPGRLKFSSLLRSARCFCYTCFLLLAVTCLFTG